MARRPDASRNAPVHVGCAGWSIPAAHRALSGSGDSALARYATVFDLVEINSSFHRPHRRDTYARWAAATPDGFRFTVKLPRAITHDARLVRSGPALDAFLAQCTGLGEKLACLLVQLPPSLPLERRSASTFLAMLRRRWDGGVACEPRHASWFGEDAEDLLRTHRIARVAADPAPHPGAATPGGDSALRYRRWHGSPRTYYSAYDDTTLQDLARRVASERAAAGHYVIFDNTAHGHAVPNAARFRELAQRAPRAR